MKKEEGVEKDIDELRGLLNKLTQNNYDDMQKNILSSLTNIINKNCKETDLEKIGEAIFEIGSINKFWSALYAKLYKSILSSFPLMQNIYEKNFKNFLQLFTNIRFVPAEENYDEFSERFLNAEGNLIFYAISVRSYENLALNMADIKRYIEQQSEIIVYYEEAVTEDISDNISQGSIQ